MDIINVCIRLFFSEAKYLELPSYYDDCRSMIMAFVNRTFVIIDGHLCSYTLTEKKLKFVLNAMNIYKKKKSMH